MDKFNMSKICVLVIFSFSCVIVHAQNKGILFPQDSESRETKSLDGIWNFRPAPRLNPIDGFLEEWFAAPLRETGEVENMPVPSSYQDITQRAELRDHIGWVWYDREFWVPKDWANDRTIFIRFGSVYYESIVWINGIQVTQHSRGHVPFQVELTNEISFTGPNRITVAVNNTLTPDTVPQGFVKHKTGDRYPPGHFIMEDGFDFFKYAGIHRPVILYSTPKAYVDDITVVTDVIGTTGQVTYQIDTVTQSSTNIRVSLQDKNGVEVALSITESGILNVPNAKLWWPYTMVNDQNDAGYLYTLVVRLQQGTTTDIYRLKIGIRSVKWSDTTFLINDRPFYFTGFGRHEDSALRGKGLDNVLLVKDHNLIKWTGGNSYRTTHYPYSEELMDMVDSLGIVIIDECSAVSLTIFGPGLLQNHKNDMTDLVQRDKNRPSVVMWSVANEPRSEDPNAEEYFRQIYEHTKALDSTRPVGIVLFTNYANDKAAQFYDIVCLNRYHAWYSDVAEMEVVNRGVIVESLQWMNLYKKPFIYSEYGADTVAGLHTSPSWMFTEEFQTEYMREHFKAFDTLRTNTSVTFIGEMIWNFADFMTKPEVQRVVGNRKGVFTRDRQPKASAHLLRSRYHLLANEYYDYPIPSDLQHFDPVYSSSSCAVSSSADATYKKSCARDPWDTDF